MSDTLHQKGELRYGYPAADLILANRYYTIGYSFYFRQAKWALELVDPDRRLLDEAERKNVFRPDFRVPMQFRGDLDDYKNSNYDRGHLVPSANRLETQIQNSETFLLSNMSPQKPSFNRVRWAELEKAVRKLDKKKDIAETYVLTGPMFDFDKRIELIGKNDDNGVTIPVPSHFFKCVLAITYQGKINMWAFEMPNSKLSKPLPKYRVTTAYIEKRVGMEVWSGLIGAEVEKIKGSKKRMWSLTTKYLNPPR